MLQVKFILGGLLLAGAFIGYQWLKGLPPIPPVEVPGLAETPRSDGQLTQTQGRQLQERDVGAAPLETVDSAAFEVDESAAVGVPNELLPALNDSDGWLRKKLASTTLPWLAETELIRTSATVLANAARGEVPRKFVGFLAPAGKFTVSKHDGRLTTDPAAHTRYSSFVASLTSVDPASAAELFALAEPLLVEALRELGGDADGNVASPRELVTAALGIALATPPEGVDAALVRPSVIYKYADKELEALAPLQKQLLRMGPENLSALRPWLYAFAVALGLELPAED